MDIEGILMTIVFVLVAFIIISVLGSSILTQIEMEKFCEEQNNGEKNGAVCIIEESGRLVYYKIVEYKGELRLVLK